MLAITFCLVRKREAGVIHEFSIGRQAWREFPLAMGNAYQRRVFYSVQYP